MAVLNREQLQGFRLLNEVLTNQQMGLNPVILYRRLEIEYGIDVASLREGAIGQDAGQNMELERRVLEDAAFRIAQVDGERAMKELDERDERMTREDLKEVLEKLQGLNKMSAHGVGITGGIINAYKQGLGGRVAEHYIQQNHYVHHLDQKVEAQELETQGRDADTELAILEIRRERRDTGGLKGDVDDFAISLARESKLQAAASNIAREKLERRAVEIAERKPQLSAEDALREARLSFVREGMAADGIEAKRAADRLAWGVASLEPVRATVGERRQKPTGRGRVAG